MTTLQSIDAYWRAANYLSVGQIYLLDNPLLTEPLRPEHIKPRLLGHWGTTPGLNFCFAHLNRIIAERDQEMIYIAGPGHGGPAAVAHAWLEGSYSETYPEVSQDAAGMRTLFRQFSFPGGIPSHVAPETPGSIHEGGELGYSLAHAFGAAFDNPRLVVACVVGDGEAETGPLAASWHSNKLLDPDRDGVVLPILHLNGYKIANPTVLARIPESELLDLMEGYGYRPHIVGPSHEEMARTLDEVFDQIAAYKDGRAARLPMIILRTPKGWTGPREVDGLPVEGTWRAHQVPLSGVRDNPGHLAMLEEWMQGFAQLGMLALAIGITMIAGEFDLSVAGTYALGSMLAVHTGQTSPVMGVLAAVAAGAGVGAMQGGLIARLRIPSMPVTLATYIALLGLTYAMSGGLSKTYANGDVTLWVDQTIAGVFSPRSLLTLVAFLIAAIVLGFTKLGRELRAIGGDRRASRVAGVGVDRRIVEIFTMSGTLAALGGALLGYSYASANPDPGLQPLILSVVAALLGGVSLAGGRGGPLGLLAGTLSVALIAQLVAVTALPDFTTQLLYAVLLATIVAIESPGLHQTMERLRTRRTRATRHLPGEPR
ncbi:hypothetical protein [Nonomuraea sp. NPDC050643]|uniref:ABC transporter permease subunit n=1 Tax=Nonomuraea sp. NPDC050643 TaxID=3155660 RepID=UPI0033C7C799